MEYGAICLVPPIIAIVLALKTKNTIPSLFFAVWVGSTIINGYNPIIGFIKIISDFMIPAMSSEGNATLLILVTVAGAFICLLRKIGAAKAFAKLVIKRIKNAKQGQIMTWLSAWVFCYTEPCLMLGTIMRPVTDAVRISRAKLSYILDSTGCNLASFSPISSYGPFIASLIAVQLLEASIKGNEWSIYFQMLPFNFYSLFAMITVLIVAVFSLNIGPMYQEEARALKTGKLLADGVEPLVQVEENDIDEENVKLINFVLPMATLFISLFGVIFWTGDIMNNSLRNTFFNANITLAIIVSFFLASIVAAIVGIVNKIFTVSKGVDYFMDGMKSVITVPFILIMAWSMGSVTNAMDVGGFLSNIIQSNFNGGVVPAFIFLFGALISFSTGSSWGVWSIMMPIAFKIALECNLDIPFVVGAVVSSGMFGDQCSPISDTTILSSTAGACNHIVHVTTQLPYGIMVGAAAFCGYLFGGLTQMYFGGLLITAIILTIELVIAKIISKKKYSIESFENEEGVVTI